MMEMQRNSKENKSILFQTAGKKGSLLSSAVASVPVYASHMHSETSKDSKKTLSLIWWILDGSAAAACASYICCIASNARVSHKLFPFCYTMCWYLHTLGLALHPYSGSWICVWFLMVLFSESSNPPDFNACSAQGYAQGCTRLRTRAPHKASHKEVKVILKVKESIVI